MQGEQSESILQNLWDKSRKHTVVYLAEGRLCVTYAPPSFLPSLPPSLDLRFVNVDLCHSLVYLIPYCLFGIERQTERDAALKLGAKVSLSSAFLAKFCFGTSDVPRTQQEIFEIGLLSIPYTF